MDYVVTIPEGPMQCATTLFRLAQLNSEIKYVLHSVNDKSLRYANPQISDVSAWQDDLWTRLKNCDEDAPKFTDERRYLSIICTIRYQEIVMHLFRPTPHIRQPTKNNLQKCHESAEKTIDCWRQLYEADRMSYSWVTIHSVCLSALTILYCIWSSPDIAASTQIDAFTSTMRNASVLLSAAGEYWTEARRSRSRLDALATATVRWLADKLKTRTNSRRRPPSRNKEPQVGRSSATVRTDPGTLQSQPSETGQNSGNFDSGYVDFAFDDFPDQQFSGLQSTSTADFDMYISNQDLASFLGAPDSFAGDNSILMDGMFSDYQPSFEFNGRDMAMPWSF